MKHPVLDTAPCFCFTFTDEGKILYINTTLCTALGYNKEELENKKLENIFTLPTRIFHQTHMFPLLKLQGQLNEIFISLVKKNNDELPVLMNASRKINGAAINTCMGILVENRHKYETELVNAKKDMEAALKENTELLKVRQELQSHTARLDESLYKLRVHNDELKQFNKVVTHDLQEPLRKLFFFAEQLQHKTTDLPAEGAKAVGKMMNASAQMRGIVSGLQEYIWLTEQAPQFSTVNLNELLAEAEKELLEVFNGKHWQIVADRLPAIQGDTKQLIRLFYFILENAVRFRKPSHKAHIKVGGTIVRQNRFRTVEGKYQYADHLMLRIADNGTGFDPEQSHVVFDLFKKLHMGKGRGLGLALSRKITDIHQGMISAETSLQGGTTIIIFLPLQQSS